MVARRILRAGHPVLRQVAAPVIDPTDPAIAALVQDMRDSLAEVGGIGLAAPQIGVSLRVVIYRVPAERVSSLPGDREVPMTVMINPVLTPVAPPGPIGAEACLSVPGLVGMVARSPHLRLQYQTLAGEVVSTEAVGYHARVVQHECDHLDGVLYIDKLADPTSLVFRDELTLVEFEAARAATGATA
ncbi:MAG: peptide deformylase [Alphaproteobacteria bacterium]|nr:MAG: peptide deformylase [Alphaproteobacteria bacterium]